MHGVILLFLILVGAICNYIQPTSPLSPINSYHYLSISPSHSKPILSISPTLCSTLFSSSKIMAVVEYADEIKVQVSPKRMFKALITDGHHILPKIVPHIFKSIDVLEGEGGATGCVRQLNFPDGAPFSHMKDKLEVVDTKNLVATIVLFEGPGLGDKMESLRGENRFVDSGDGGCIIKWKNHHHLKAGHSHISEDEFKAAKEHGMTFFTATADYLAAHPDVCA